MEEGMKNEHGQEAEKASRLAKVRGFAIKHRRKLILAGAGVVAGGIALIIYKSPELREKIFVRLCAAVNEDEHTGISDVMGISNESLDSLAGPNEKIDVLLDVQSVREYEGNYYSAAKLGEMIGKSAQWVNKKLCELGYLTGVPGNWTATEKGKAISRLNAFTNDVGGYYSICEPYYEWREDIIYELGDPDEYRARIERIFAKVNDEFSNVA